MRRTYEVLITDDPVDWDKGIIKDFLLEYSTFVANYSLYGIQLKISPCYYYNGKYHSDKRNSGCSLVFRIRLFPNNLTFSQAVEKGIYQEFFSRVVGHIKKTHQNYVITKRRVKDVALERFLKKHLQKAILLSEKKKSTNLAIKESIGDILRSLVCSARYKHEVKLTIKGISLEYVFLFIAIVLIAFRVYARLRRLGIL